MRSVSSTRSFFLLGPTIAVRNARSKRSAAFATAIGGTQPDWKATSIAFAHRPSRANGSRISWPLCIPEFQCRRVEAIAQPRGWWAIFENVAQVGIASAAHHFHAAHEQRIIHDQRDMVFIDRLPEAGPAGARIELGIGIKEGLAATVAGEGTFLLRVPVDTRESAFGAFLTGDSRVGLGGWDLSDEDIGNSQSLPLSKS